MIAGKACLASLTHQLRQIRFQELNIPRSDGFQQITFLHARRGGMKGDYYPDQFTQSIIWDPYSCSFCYPFIGVESIFNILRSDLVVSDGYHGDGWTDILASADDDILHYLSAGI